MPSRRRARRGAAAEQREGLAPELKALVHTVEATLGQVVREREGEALYAAVEAVRQEMVAFRSAGGASGRPDARAQTRALARASRVLERLGPRQRAALGRAYTLYLELVNVCENAYRTHRLRRRAAEAGLPRSREKRPPRARLTWVLTAHPTESRAPENIRLLHRVQALLVRGLERGEQPSAERLAPLLHLAWRVGTHPRDKPSVEDEARHIYSLLSDPVLEAMLDLAGRGHRIRLRTWVGGDKDGHAGVGARQTLASLQLARERLLGFVRARLLPTLAEDVALLAAPPVHRAQRRLLAALEALERVGPGDGRRVANLDRALAELRARWVEAGGREHPRLLDLARLLEQLPGLVVPLELREERGLFQPEAPIAGMLKALGQVARGGRVDSYLRGCVVSMVTRAEDLQEALDLVTRLLPAPGRRGRATPAAPAVPVIPLFELPEVLPRAAEILDGALADPRYLAATREHGALEVMLGYSDTSKRMGVLASRLAIHDAMTELGRWGERRRLPLVFFHGSGGSEGRGGGTPEEQAATWPPDALGLIKTTLQGEMIERTLASPEILVSQVEKVAAVQAAPPSFAPPGALARELGRRSQAAYVAWVRDPAFQDLLQRATPYARLDALRIGSRPARRRGPAGQKASGEDAMERLRAIPWVLCWTQTRLLLPVWLGVGSAWRALRGRPRAAAALKHSLAADPLLRAFVRLLGFSLAKAEPRVWREYVRRLAPDAAPGLLRRLEGEWEAALDLARRASPTGELLPDRAWLRESIHYRAPMIHPLNLLQIEALAGDEPTAADEALLRETITGIAAGMLTTG